jgi:hypothetical protein
MTKTLRSALALCALFVGALSYTAGAYACDGHHGDHDGDHAAQSSNDSRFASFKNHHGTFRLKTTLTSPDSGTCGNDWATDTLKRTYVVKKKSDGTYMLVAFDRGTFTTVAGQSPGACNTGTSNGSTVPAGITGGVTGFVVATITGGTLNTHATCANPCTRAAFETAFFGASAHETVTKFAFVYGAKDPSLAKRFWLNSGTGTTSHNRGDITTTA